MLELYVPGEEFFNNETQEFSNRPGGLLKLEHSLLSVRKWESKWKKSFLSTKELTGEELISYIQCMTIGQRAAPEFYERLDVKTIRIIKEYMDAPMTATTFKTVQNSIPNREIITSEIIYYWMIEHGIPFECEKWHLNQLLTLIHVCNIKGSKGKKMSKRDIMKQNAELNAARRKASGSKG